MTETLWNEPAGAPTAQLSVGIVLLPNFTMVAFAAFLDCLRLAADDGDTSRAINCRWRLMSAGESTVTASCGAQIGNCESLRDPADFDYVAVVGGLLPREPDADRATLAYLQRAADKRIPLIGLCTGSFALIDAGLMRRKRCCVSWYHYRDLDSYLTEIVPIADRLFVVDGDRITCAGGTAAADLAAWLIERHVGRAWAQKSLHIMLIDQARRGSASQPQPAFYQHVSDNRVRRAILLIEQFVATPIHTDELARKLNVSRRQLERAFRHELDMSPNQFSRSLRLRYGYWLLQNTPHSIADISTECGFADTAHFSHNFRWLFDQTPSSIRDQSTSTQPASEAIHASIPVAD